MKIKLILFVAACFTACLLIVSAKECNHRHITAGGEATSTVCVCSEKLGCDDLAHVKVDKTHGTVTSYVTDRDGARFTQRVSHFGTTAAPTAAKDKLVVNLDRKKRYQKITGFGGAFTDLGGYNIAQLPKPLQERVIRDYFADDGLEYRINRVVIGGCDESLRLYSLDDHPAPGDTLANFALQDEDQKYKIPFMKMAQQVSSHQQMYFGSPWSAPAWMKTNNKLNDGGFLKGKPGEKYYKLFAEYMVKFLEAYKKEGVHIWGITPENEPQFGNVKNGHFPYNSMGLPRALARDYIKMDLGPALHTAGFNDVKIMIIDDSLDTDFVEYAHDVLADPEAAKYVSGIANHWYGNNNNRHKLGEVSRAHPDKFLLSTEACEFLPKAQIPFGRWSSVDHYVDDILQVLQQNVSGWVEWNLALNPEAGPSWMNQHLNAPVIVNKTSGEYYKQPIFYALGHFSKFFIPDSYRIETHVTTGHKGINLVAVERPDKSIALNVWNSLGEEVNLQLHDPDRGYLSLNLHKYSVESFLWF